MNKTDFLAALEKQLKKLKKSDRKRFLDYYQEIIADYMEDGCTEEEAIRRIGAPEKIAQEILIEQKDSQAQSMPAGRKALITALLVILSVYLFIWCAPVISGSCSIAALILAVVSLIGAIPVGVHAAALGIVQFGVGIGMIGIFILTALITVKLGSLFTKATAGFTHWLKNLFHRKKGATA